MQTSSIATLNDRLLRLHEVVAITGMCKSVAYKLCKSGEFPPQVKVGVRGARWSEHAVRQWVTARVACTNAERGWKGAPEPLTVTAESNVPWPLPTSGEA